MNLREFIQSEIKSHLTDYKNQVVSENLDKYSKDAITDMIVNLSRYEGNEDLIADLKKILKNRSLGKPKRDESVKEAKFTDYDNNELAAYLKNNPKDKEAAKELSKRSKKLRDLSRTDESVNEEQLDEKVLSESSDILLSIMPFIVGGLFASVDIAAGKDNSFILGWADVLKNKWKKFKYKKNIQPIVDRLKKDTDIINFLKMPNSKQRGQWKNLILSKLKDSEKQYLNKIYKSSLLETVNEEQEQLDEKLITFSNRAPYGQIVFMAGGAGSGKGFAIDNFIDAAGFKVRDVDEMKKAVGKLDQLGKFSIDKWFDKYSNNLNPDERAHVEEFVVGKGMTISDVASNLKNPNNVAALHYIVDSMGLKDKWLINMLSGKTNKETLPNLLFDITAKKVSSITEVIKPLINAGYDSKNIHLIWVLTNYHLAVSQNKSRERVVPDDILLNTHEGAAKTIWSVLNGALPKGLNGRIDVILNNRENTVMFKDSKGNEMKGAVKGFTSLPVKKQGGGVLPEKLWKEMLYGWINANGPKTINLQKPLDTQIK